MGQHGRHLLRLLVRTPQHRQRRRIMGTAHRRRPALRPAPARDPRPVRAHPALGRNPRRRTAGDGGTAVRHPAPPQRPAEGPRPRPALRRTREPRFQLPVAGHHRSRRTLGKHRRQSRLPALLPPNLLRPLDPVGTAAGQQTTAGTASRRPGRNAGQHRKGSEASPCISPSSRGNHHKHHRRPIPE